MTEWIIPCNPKAYDVIGAFDKFNVTVPGKAPKK